MTSHHVMCHVTAVTYLFIIRNKNKNKNQKKRNIKSRKIDKRKRKMLVSKHTITILIYRHFLALPIFNESLSMDF